ncbi:MAG: Bifunctional protein Aas [Chlamydiae bacterium]|nr:Bifunctional protein Aas [Chlamydiota bacterium]
MDTKFPEKKRRFKLFFKCLFFILSFTIYRFRIKGKQHFPKNGPGLLATNRLSLIDMFFLQAKSKREIHFLIPKHYYQQWWIRPFTQFLCVIPVTTTEQPGLLVKELRVAGELLNNGYLVCLYPEENANHTGMMLSFRRCLEIIMKGRDVPIVPVYVDNIWGGFFDERFGRVVLRHFPHPITIYFGEALDFRTPVSEIIGKIQELGYEAWMVRKKQMQPVHHGFIKNVRARPFRKIIGDEKTGDLSYFKTLVGGIALSRKLNSQWQGDDNVGVILPQCVASVLANVAVTLSGRAVVNLNFSTGIEPILSAIRQADLNVVLTSREFLEKVDLEFPDEVNLVFLEDIKSTITSKDRIKALLLALTAPIRLIEKMCGARKKIKIDDTLSIIFTSGSTGDPKGVELSHFNVGSNADSISQVLLTSTGRESTMAILPFFHSFGYMLLWLGLNYDLELKLYPNPLDYAVIGDLIEKYKVSIVISTPTFLRGYVKKIPSEKFRYVRCMLTGAERMPRLLAEAFEEKYHIIPIEGYGTTECSPVISTNMLDCREGGDYPCGYVPGTVGQPLPGVMVKVVDPDTFDELPYEIPGMVLVKGPNVMKGYLNRPDLTEEVMRDGWYVTGDIGILDHDGYLHITDRLSRFSKIGGEMVPHGRVEEALHLAAQLDPLVFAVTSVPDKRKGEKLVVLHTYDENLVKDLVNKLSDQGLPNLFIPKRDYFVKVDHLPVLGSGKLDLRALRNHARSKFSKNIARA